MQPDGSTSASGENTRGVQPFSGLLEDDVEVWRNPHKDSCISNKDTAWKDQEFCLQLL